MNALDRGAAPSSRGVPSLNSDLIRTRIRGVFGGFLSVEQFPVEHAPSDIARMHAMQTLIPMSKNTADLAEILLQWMSQSPTARVIDREPGALEDESLAPEPLFRYARYNVTLTLDALARDLNLKQLERAADAPLSAARIAELAATEEPRKFRMRPRIRTSRFSS